MTRYSITIFVELETDNAILIQQKIIEIIENAIPETGAIATAGIREELEDE